MKIIVVILLLLNGCQFTSVDVLVEREATLCQQAIHDTNSWFADLSRQECLRRLNDNHTRYRKYLRSCQYFKNRYKSSWQKLDQQIIAKAKAEKKPLPDNFKTAEEIFRDYPNPCQDSKIFEQEVKVYEAKQKVKNS